MKGSCLCGEITFETHGCLRDPAACHCTQCRKQSGHFWAAVQVDDDRLTIRGTPRWYRSSLHAQRGFCGTCGSFLFWRSDAEPNTDIALGAVDGATGLRLARHIYTANKGDYYQITDAVPQEEQET